MANWYNINVFLINTMISERNMFNHEETSLEKQYAHQESDRIAARRVELLRSPDIKLDKTVILSIIAEGVSDFIFQKLPVCQTLDSDIFLALATAAPDRINDLAENIEKFSQLDDRAANVLMNHGMSNLVLQHEQSFENVSESLRAYIKKINDPYYDPNEEFMYEDMEREREWVDEVKMSNNPKKAFLSAIADGSFHYVTNYLDSLDNQKLEHSSEEEWGKYSSPQVEVGTSSKQHVPGLDKEVALALIKWRRAGEVVKHLEKFSGMDKEIAEALIKANEGDSWGMLKKIDCFGEPLPEILDDCLNNLSWIAETLKKEQGYHFVGSQNNKELRTRFYDRANLLFNQDVLLKFKELDPRYLQNLTNILSQASRAGHNFADGFFKQFSVFKNLKKDSWEEMTSLASQWIPSGIDVGPNQENVWGKLLSHRDSFSEPSQAEMAREVSKKMGRDFLINNLHYFTELPLELGQELVRYKLNELVALFTEDDENEMPEYIPRHNYDAWGEDYDDQPPQPARQSNFTRRFNNIMKNCQKITEFFGENVDRAFYRVLEDWGESENFLTFYNVYNGLLNGKISNELKDYGVTKTGDVGIKELHAEIKKRLDAVLWKGNESAIREALRGDDMFVLPAVKQAVRLHETQWGNTSEEAMVRTFEEYLERREKLQPLRDVYKPSETLFIKKIDKNKETKSHINFTPDFISRYTQIVESLRNAQRLLPTAEGLNPVLDRIKEKAKKVQIELKNKTASMENEKARTAIHSNLAKLEEVLNGSMNPQEQFTALRTFKGEFDEELRELMLFLGFHFNPTYAEKDLATFNTEHPSLDELTWVLNFVDHIVNKETLSKYFTDKKAAQNFRGLLSVTALEDALKQFQDEPTKGTTPFKFIPDRGILTEFSGHISDACWASKYSSILEQFPNFTSLIMIQNPDNKFERIAGAAFLIEAESNQGEKLLIIRGLNPQENVINQLSVKDFYKQLTEYLKPIAASDGRKLAIVIDGHSGGSATNRPVLFAHLDGLQERLSPVRLNPAIKTEFNGYRLDGVCYLVE